MAVAHNNWIIGSRGDYHLQETTKAIPSPADGVSRLGFGAYQTRGPVIRLPGDGLFFTRRKLGRGRRSASPGGD
jgi:hypothetical protein